MKIDRTCLIAAAIVLQAVASSTNAGDLRFAQAVNQPAMGQGFGFAAKQGKCVKNLAGTKWKGTKYLGGSAFNVTVVFNAGGVGVETTTIAQPIQWQQFGPSVQWKKNIEDGYVIHKPKLQCNSMMGKFYVHDIAGPLLSSGTIKLNRVN